MANTVDLSKLRTELEMDTTKFDQGTAKAQKDLKTLDSSFQKTQTQIKNSLTSIDKHTVASTKSMTSSIKTLREHTEKEFVKTRKAIDSLGTSVTKVNNSTKSITNAVKKLTTVSTEIKNGVKGVTESVKSNTKAVADMEKSVVKSVDNISKSIKSLNTINEDKLAGSIKKAFTNTKGDVLASTQALRQFRKELALARQEAGKQSIKPVHPMLSYKTLNIPQVKVASDVKYPTYQAPKEQTISTKNLSKDLDTATNSAYNFWGASKGILGTFQKISFNIFLLRQGLMQAYSAFESVLAPAVNFSMAMETNQVGMAGILSSMTEINGKSLEWNDAMGISKSIISDLNKEAVKTSATSEELIETFRALLGSGLGAGMNIDQIKEFTVVGVNAVKSLGLDGRQLIQELRDLVQGGIQPASSTLATALGLKDSDIKAAKNSAEGLFSFLMKRMEGFKYASLATGSTFKGMIDQVKEGYTLITAQAFSPFIEELRSIVKSVRDYMLELDENGNATGFSKTLIENLTAVGIVAKDFLQELKKIFNFIISVGSPAFKLLGNLIAFVADHFSTFVGLLAGAKIYSYAKQLYEMTSATNVAAKAQTNLGGAIQLVDKRLLRALESEKAYLKSLQNDYNEQIFQATNAFDTVKANYEKRSIERVNTRNTNLALAHLEAVSQKASSRFPELSEELDALAERIPKITQEYTKLGLSAEQAEKLQLKVVGLVLKGKARQAAEVLKVAEASLIEASATKQSIIAHKMEVTTLEEEIALRAQKASWLMRIGSLYTTLGITIMSVNSLIGDSNSELSKQMDSFGQSLMTLGLAINGVTQLYTVGIPTIMEWITKLTGAFSAAKVAGAGFIATLKGITAPAIIIGGTIGTLTAGFYALANGISFAEIKARYFATRQDRLNSSLPTATRALKGDKELSDEELAELRMERDMEKHYKKMQELMAKNFGGGGGATVDKGASRRAKGAYKALESAYKQLEDLAKKQQDKLDIYYNNDLVSTQDYIDNKYTLQKLLLESEIKNLEERKKVAERLGQESDVENFNSKIETAKDNLAGLGEKSRLEAIEEYKKLEDRLDSVKSKYEELFGVTQKGFEYNLAKEFSKDITRVNKEIETALVKLGIAEQNNNDVEKKLWEERLSRYQETQKQIKKIIELKGLEREADLAKAEIARIDLEIQGQYLDIQDKVNRLAQTQAEADGDLFLFRKEHMSEYIEQYTTLIAKYEDMANKAEDLATRNKYKQMALEAKEALNELMNAVPPFQKAMKEQVIDSLSDAFQSMLWQEKTAKEALEDFAKSILQTWSKKVFDEVATAMTDGLFNMFLPKSEKANAKENKEIVNQKVAVKVNADITDFVNNITNQSVSLQQSLTERLIPAVNATAQTFEEVIEYLRGLIGTTPNGGTPDSGIPATEGTPNFGVNIGATSSSNYAYPSGISASIGDFTKNADKLSISASNLKSEFSSITPVLKNAEDATKANADAASQAGGMAIPMMITSLLSASGVLGKFGVVLQGVMMAMQIGKMAGFWKFADGGYVSGAGTATSDSIPARLSNGEYVLKASSVKALGTDFLDTLNNVGGYSRSSKLPKFAFADGGYVNATQNAQQEGIENIPKTIQSSPQVVMNMTFQSLDPESNMKMMEAQYPSIRNRLIRDLQSNASMRTAVKGASK